MADLHPIGTIIQIEYPPDWGSNHPCSGHSLIFDYEIIDHVATEAFGRTEFQEIIFPFNSRCKEKHGKKLD